MQQTLALLNPTHLHHHEADRWREHPPRILQRWHVNQDDWELLRPPSEPRSQRSLRDHQDLVHRARITLGEWALWELQQQASRWTIGQGDLLWSAWSKSAHRRLEDPLQQLQASSLGYKPPAPVTVLPASFISPNTGRAAWRRLKPKPILTSGLDHFDEVGHRH